MRAGRLRHPIDIQAATETRNAHGDVVPEWATIVRRRAAIVPLVGRELMEAKQINSRTTHRLLMRYWADLTPSHRIVHKDRNLNIISIRNLDEAGRDMEVMCVEDT